MEVFGVVTIDNVNQSVAMDMEEIIKACVDKEHKMPTLNVGHDRPSGMLITTATGLHTSAIDRLIRVGGICQTLMDERGDFIRSSGGQLLSHESDLELDLDTGEGIAKDLIEEIHYVFYSESQGGLVVQLNNLRGEWLFIHN